MLPSFYDYIEICPVTPCRVMEYFIAYIFVTLFNTQCLICFSITYQGNFILIFTGLFRCVSIVHFGPFCHHSPCNRIFACIRNGNYNVLQLHQHCSSALYKHTTATDRHSNIRQQKYHNTEAVTTAGYLYTKLMYFECK